MEPTEGVTTTAPPSTTPPSTTPPSARLSVIVLAVGTTWVALHSVGWLDPDGEITFGLLGLTSAIATAIGVYRWKPEPRWPWLTMLAAQIVALAGGGVRAVLDTLGDLTAERSLVPDLLTLPAYLLLAVSLAGLARSSLRSRDASLDAVLDAIIASLALLTLAWVYLVTPALAQADAPLSVRIVLAAYPPASMFVVAMAARMLFSSARRPPFAFRLVMVCMVGLLVGDVLYMLADTGLTEIPRTMLDVPYALAYVALAAAVLHPSIRKVSESVAVSDDTPRLSRLVFVAAALSVPVIVLLVPAETLETTGERVVVGSIVLLLTGAASWRMFRALRQQARAQQRLIHQATHDPLTGLGNRLFVLDHLNKALGDERRSSLAVLVIDLDRFKLVNDSMGHHFGDELLLAVAKRLSESVRPGDVMARVGGDEFLAVLHGVPDEAAARDAAERARLGFKYPLRAGDVDMVVSASVGVSFLAPGDDGEVKAETLLRDADTAMSQAKDAGRDTVAVFDTSMRHRVAERILLERELRHALARGELAVHYQPKVRMSDGRVTGMEALLRWTHPTLGSIRPDVFIPIAEDTGMIDEIGLWVLNEACTKLAELRAGLKQPELLTMSVNLSVRQLRADDLVDNVARALLRNGLPGNALCLELTESMLMENVDGIRRQLEAVRSCGAKLSIDDFGTGYSSLAYLRGLAVDEVKIDRAFVKDLGEEGGPGESVVAAVVAITSSMGIATVAEGVEIEEQVEILRELGCTEAQGFHFGRPVPGNEIADLLERIGMASGPRLRVIHTA